MSYYTKRAFYAHNLHRKFEINEMIEDELYNELNPKEKQNFRFLVVSSSVEPAEKLYKETTDEHQHVTD